jgi:hypothetical protein
MIDLDIQAVRLRYLQRIYELSGGSTIQGVPTSQIDSDLGISDEDDPKIVTYLSAKGLANYSTFGHVSITARGIDEAERAMRSSYAEKERSVLQRIYEMGGVRHTDWVSIDALVRDLRMDFREVNDILIDLEERKGLIDGLEEAVRMIPAGIELLEGGGRDARATPNVSYTTNIQGSNYGGIQQGGERNVQNITLINNPDFDKAITSLIELIRTSSIPNDDKEEVQEELSKISKLALREPGTGLLERAKTRLDVVKLAMTGTDIAIKAAPHLETLWEFIKHKFGG